MKALVYFATEHINSTDDNFTATEPMTSEDFLYSYEHKDPKIPLFITFDGGKTFKNFHPFTENNELFQSLEYECDEEKHESDPYDVMTIGQLVWDIHYCQDIFNNREIPMFISYNNRTTLKSFDESFLELMDVDDSYCLVLPDDDQLESY